MRVMVFLSAALALAACDAAPNRNAANRADGNSTPDVAVEIAELPVGQQNEVFLRAILDANVNCQGVTGSERITVETDGRPTWRATCVDGSTHLIQVGPDGTAVVVTRTDGQ